MPKLTIDIEARLAQFQDSLDGLHRRAETTAGRLNSAFGALKGTLVSLGGIASIGLLATQFRDLIGAASNLDDLAEKTGASVEELSKLSQVARISGTSLETVESTMVRLTKALHGTDDEAKGAGAALAALGLSAEELKSLDTGVALKKVADALNEFQDGSNKSAAALALFGKAGAQALPFLKDLATETGIAARVTAEQAAKAEELEKSLRRLANSSSVAKTEFALGMVPALQELVDAITIAKRESGLLAAAWVALGGVGANVFGQTQKQQAAKRIAEINEVIETGRKQLEAGSLNPGGGIFSALIPDVGLGKFDEFRIRQNIAKLKREAAELEKVLNPPKPVEAAKPLLDFKETSKERTAKVSPFDAEVKRLEELALKTQELTVFEETLAHIQKERFGKLNADQVQALKVLAATVDFEKERVRSNKEFAEAAAKVQEENARNLVAAEEKLNAIAEKTRDIIDPTRAWKREVEEMVKAYERGRITIEELNAASQNPRLRGLLTPEKTDRDVLNEALKEGDISLDKYMEALRRLSPEMEKTNDLAKDLGLTFSSAFEDAVIGGKKLGDVVRGLGQDLAKLFLRKTVTEPLANSAGGLFKDLLGGIFGGPGSSGGGEIHLAAGGPIWAGQTALVGERGPEIITAGRDGVVIPNHALGGGPVFNVDLRGASVEAVARLERLVHQVNGSIESRAVAAVGGARSRGMRV